MTAPIKRIIKQVFANRALIKHFCKILKSPVAMVLGYHGISEGSGCPSWLRIPRQRFEEQLRMLGEFCNFIEPSALFNPSALRPDRPNLLITFDDGYADNYHVAAPVLEKYRAPAQFFVTTANMQCGELFWFDKIIIPIQTQAMERIDLRHLGLRDYVFGKNCGQNQRWSAVQQLLEDMKKLEHTNRNKVIDHFSKRFKEVIEKHFNDFRPLTARELNALAASPLHSIGSHSHHHTILTELPSEKLAENLRTSKTILEELTQQPINDIALPNGNSDHRVRQQIISAGYRVAYGVLPGLVDSRTDRYRIPRTLIGAFDDLSTILSNITRQILKCFFV